LKKHLVNLVMYSLLTPPTEHRHLHHHYPLLAALPSCLKAMRQSLQKHLIGQQMLPVAPALVGGGGVAAAAAAAAEKEGQQELQSGCLHDQQKYL
jgi:hypothetical protein